MGFSTRCMAAADWAKVKNFKPGEFVAPEKMGLEFVRWIDQVRDLAGVPMHITSSYRDPAYNKKVGGAQDSAHTDVPCNSVDIGPRPSESDPHGHGARFKIVDAAIRCGAVRIGFYKDGSLHIDRSESTRPAPRLWNVVDTPA